MSVRFLATGDLQCHNWRQFSYTLKNGMNSRLANCLKVFDVLRKEASKNEIKKIIINGDIFEDNNQIEVEVFDAVYLKLERMYDEGFEVVINLGNHDVSKQSGRRILHSLRAFRKVATVLEKPTLVWGCVFVVPWDSSPNRIKETIRSCEASKETALIGHFGVQGATTGPESYLIRNPIKLHDIRHSEFGLVLLSDYHTRQRLSKNTWYMGSPIQHSFGEIHRPCIWKVSLDREGVFRTHKIYTNFPQFRRVRGSDISKFFQRPEEYSNDYIKISDVEDTKLLRKLSRRYGIQYKIEHTAEDLQGEDAQNRKEPKTFANVLDKYVKRETSSKREHSRLLSLGKKLYKGEI